MPVRKNGYYADPALGTAFDNLAAAFATPSGADVAGYARGGAEREKAARLADLYAYAKDPNYDQARADRMGIAAGNYTPIQSFYAQDQNNSTTRRGQDVKARADTDVAGINNAGALARQLALPVSAKDGEIVRLPEQTAAATGLPAMFRGNITTKPGETVTQPDGSVISGMPIPMTNEQVRGAILQGLPQPEQRAVALQGVGVSPIVDAITNKPKNVLTPDAAGQTPYVADNRQAQVANYKHPATGAAGTARLEAGKWVDTQTGQELPPGIQTYTASLAGGKDQTGLGTGTNNDIDGMLVDLTLTESTSKSLRNIVANNPAVQGLAGNIRGTVQDVLQAGGEVGQLFNANMDKMKADIAAGRIDPAVVQKFANFDPNIPAAAMLETLLTAQVAKLLDPNGRISNDRYQQVAKAIGAGGMTSNTAKTLATLDQIDKMIADRRAILAPVRPAAAAIGQGGATAAPAPTTPAAPEVWERGPDGQLRRAQ